MKADSSENGHFIPSKGLKQTLLGFDRHQLFGLVAVISFAFFFCFVVTVFTLVKNYDETDDALYENLVKERLFLQLFNSLKQAEFAAHDFFSYEDPDDVEIFGNATANAIHTLEKFKDHEKMEPEDEAQLRVLQNKIDQWKDGLTKYYSAVLAGPKTAKSHSILEKDFKNNHARAEQIWEDCNRYYYKEQYEHKQLDNELTKVRRNLWITLVVIVGGLMVVLGGMLFVLRKYLDYVAENTRILEEKENRYRAIVEDQTEFICRSTSDGTMLFVNGACCRFNNISFEEQVGKKWQDFIQMDSANIEYVSKEVASICFEKPTVTIESIYEDYQGTPRCLQFVHRGIFNSKNQLIEIQSVGRDITELKNTQKRLEASNELLEYRVAERTRELEAALAKARESERSKENYLAIMSHEMRTPLHSMSGFAEMLLDTNLNHEQRRYIENIASQNDVLLQLINDILDFSRLESNKVTLEITSFNLHALIEQIVFNLQPLAAVKNISLTYYIHKSAPAYVKGDPKRLRSIMTNLLGNAVKFTNSGTVTLGVKPSSKAPDLQEGKTTLITFEVKDTGIGIPKNRIPDLFQMYSRIETSHSATGTGLGLAICKRLCDLMNGKIWVESVEGQGSTFSFEIPLVNSMPIEEESQASTSAPSDVSLIPALAILVVEDNAMASTLLRDFLFKMGLWTDYCATGKEAIHKITKHNFDMVFMDLNLPDIGGDDAVKTIRANKEIAHQPIIVGLSASALKADREKCMEAGMNDFLLKPVKQNDLANMINKWSGKTSDTVHPSDIDQSTLESFNELSRRTGKNTWQIISDTFVEETPSIVTRIRESCEKHDQKQVRHFAHYLQGGADILGAKALSELCKKILDSANATVTEETSKLVKELEISSENVIRSLRGKEF